MIINQSSMYLHRGPIFDLLILILILNIYIYIFLFRNIFLYKRFLFLRSSFVAIKLQNPVIYPHTFCPSLFHLCKPRVQGIRPRFKQQSITIFLRVIDVNIHSNCYLSNKKVSSKIYIYCNKEITST